MKSTGKKNLMKGRAYLQGGSPEHTHKRELIILTAIVAVGAIIRFLSCFWGYPYQLHPDEPLIVDKAMDMISRHSYEPQVFIRPDHFEIKCCAVLFQIVSYVLYHVSAPAAFAEHRMVFFLVARAYTAVFGVLLIVLVYKYVEAIKNNAKLIAAALVAFYPILVQHSAYATPDVVLSFFVIYAAYCSMLYLESGERKRLTLMCVAAGIGITVKYSCALCCVWIAIVVCIYHIQRKDYLGIIKTGAYSVLIVFCTVFFVAPNLFTNIGSTLAGLGDVSGSAHLGADGLDFWGKLGYYMSVFLSAAGYEAVPALALGIVFIVYEVAKKQHMRPISLGLGLLFYFCTSALGMHWERWGMPFYVFFLIYVSLGLAYLFELTKGGCRWLPFALGVIIVANCTVSGLLTAQNALTTDSGRAGLSYCEEHGITPKNTLYDGYSPFLMGGMATIDVKYDENNMPIVPSGIRYLITSSNMKDRYCAEPEKYPVESQMYENIQTRNELLYQVGGPYYDHSGFGIANIFLAAKGLLSHNADSVTGYEVSIYKIPGPVLGADDFDIKYIGEDDPKLDEEHDTLEVLVQAKDGDAFFLNSDNCRLAYHVYDRNGELVLFEGIRTEFGSFSGSIPVAVRIDTAAFPGKGEYTLEITAVQEHVAWFEDLGFKSIFVDVEIV